MFEAVMSGTPVAEAIAHYVDAMKKQTRRRYRTVLSGP